MNPPHPVVEGVVTDAWPYVIASYGLLWVTLVAYGAWHARQAHRTDAPAADRVAAAAIVGGAVWVVLGVGIAGYDYVMALTLPKSVLYAWATPGILATTYGIVRQT